MLSGMNDFFLCTWASVSVYNGAHTHLFWSPSFSGKEKNYVSLIMPNLWAAATTQRVTSDQGCTKVLTFKFRLRIRMPSHSQVLPGDWEGRKGTVMSRHFRDRRVVCSDGISVLSRANL